ncbi:MAG TPA: glycoside hydrolase family 30 beta sandwich domain-containing protein [Bacteroidales bacterium]|nr:glycoside hydrolase family 30 beta sandwich domain-containing protein [Bacteroidales bacterium]HNT92703.1 glycoside hydrolase family 30 beta sandwich domain-containing protein [Bacteroidales bacterium]HOO65807.1 glycoside hydrolase family 30 beta sandwich domain-containing protein [Bacteroidales bacterium]HPE22643.1 glycoside hydrolase family 30 beta sandwich domain-containing protein [Bacteroidales bacterium]
MPQVLAILLALLLAGCNRQSENGPGNGDGSDITATAWITAPQQGILFEKQDDATEFVTAANSDPTIVVDTTVTYQEIDGFGNCLTGGSAILLKKMGHTERTALLRELFSPEGNGIGISYLRISIGASDLSDRVFTYCELPPGETDPLMEQFSIEPEKEDLIPVLKEILSINPSLKIMGSPWTAPLWMKTNNASVGGSLKREWFDAYALYFVRYIEAMEAEDIHVDAITVQNEPLHGGNNPSMVMTAADQAHFIGQSLGPAFREAGIDTKIIIYDHNADRTDYPLAVLADDEARQYIDGSAFHLYGGSIDALTAVHNAWPAKNLYFTEQWVGGPGDLAGDLKWHVENLIIGATRNWCRTVLEWNLASDPSYDPHTEGGCDRCLGTVTIDGNRVERNPAWYILAHASKFVRPGSVRVSSTIQGNLPNVAFMTPEGEKVLIVLNTSDVKKNFNVRFRGLTMPVSLHGGAVGTWIW